MSSIHVFPWFQKFCTVADLRQLFDDLATFCYLPEHSGVPDHCRWTFASEQLFAGISVDHHHAHGVDWRCFLQVFNMVCHIVVSISVTLCRLLLYISTLFVWFMDKPLDASSAGFSFVFTCCHWWWDPKAEKKYYRQYYRFKKKY